MSNIVVRWDSEPIPHRLKQLLSSVEYLYSYYKQYPIILAFFCFLWHTISNK